MAAAWVLPGQPWCFCTPLVGSLCATQRSVMPLRTARDCRAKWMATFTAINSLLPNYLIHHMHTETPPHYEYTNTHTHTAGLNYSK